MFGKKTIRDEYAKAVNEIVEGRRRDPKHQWPDGTKSKWGPGNVDPVDQYVFDEFYLFGATLDRETSDAWSFESTSDIARRAWYLDSPEYGRRWIVSYNAIKLGWVEVSASPAKLFGTVDEFRLDPAVRVDLQLDLMRFIASEDTFGLLYEVAFYMQHAEGGYDEARARARLKAESSMTHYMWDVMLAGNEYVPELNYAVSGPYTVFRETIAHWQETGYDPLTYRQNGE